MDVESYLARIDADLPPRLSLDYLAHLQLQHLLSVPFENLSVMWGEPVVAQADAVVHKIVTRRRGGFCYELNGAFGTLLTALGFSVQSISAQVYQGKPGQFGPAFDHLALLVRIEQIRYLVDVGFGDSCRRPLRFDVPSTVDDVAENKNTKNPILHSHITEDISGRYRISPATGDNAPPADDPHLWLLESQTATAGDTGDIWTPQYRFADVAHTLHNFEAMCAYHSSNRQSGFTRRIVCSRATPTGRFTLSNDRLIITRDSHKSEFPITKGDQISRILRAYFGVVI